MPKTHTAAAVVIAMLALTGCDSQTGPADESEPTENVGTAPPILDSDTGPADEDVEDIEDDDVADAPEDSDATDAG